MGAGDALVIAKYFVAKPAAVHVTRDGREICSEHAAGKREYRKRTEFMSLRQRHLCAICGKFMVDPTFDHEAGRGFGGGFRDDSLFHADGTWRNAAVHFLCNGQKGSRAYRWQNGKYLPVERNVA